MPDFAKALRWLHPRPASFDSGPRSETRDPGLFDLSTQLEFLRKGIEEVPVDRRRTVEEFLPPGAVERTPKGSHYIIRSVYGQEYFHGKVRLGRFAPGELASLVRLMHCRGGAGPARRPRGAKGWTAATPMPAVVDRERVLFLDTETTGMQGGTGICPFLIGVGYYRGEEFHLVQYFIRDFDEEPSMLLALESLLDQFDVTVTYNGAAFDLPLIETRLTLARMSRSLDRLSHYDLLFTARRLWRAGHGSCRLAALESEMLNYRRGPDIPGSMIPRAYFDFLARRGTGTAFRGIFSHNAADILSLAALTIHACDRVHFEPAALDDPVDLYSLGRVFEASPDWRRSLRYYEMALQGEIQEEFRFRTLENLLVIHRRSGRRDRSFEICSDLMRLQRFSFAAYEGAAIYHERTLRDYESACRVVDEGLARLDHLPVHQRWRKALEARRDRLRQKSMKYG